MITSLCPPLYVGSVEEDDPALDRTPNDRLRSSLVERPAPRLVRAVTHHPETEARHAQAGRAEIHVVHACTLPLGPRLTTFFTASSETVTTV